VLFLLQCGSVDVCILPFNGDNIKLQVLSVNCCVYSEFNG
jgi:hypothetical protein